MSNAIANTSVRKVLTASLLIALLATTRGLHTGVAAGLGDATLAVFFVAAMWLPGWRWFLLLIAVAGLTDFAAINSGVSGWCVTAAYPCLVLAYALPWLAGRHCANNSLDAGAHLRALGLLSAATVGAFVASNASFYLLSGYFGNLGAGDYAAGVVRYFWPYAGYTLLWAGLLLGGRLLVGGLCQQPHSEAA